MSHLFCMRFYPPTIHVTDDEKLFLTIPCMTPGLNVSKSPVKHQQCTSLSPNKDPPLRWQFDTETCNQAEPLISAKMLNWCWLHWSVKATGPFSPSVFEIKLPDKCVQAPSVAATL